MTMVVEISDWSYEIMKIFVPESTCPLQVEMQCQKSENSVFDN